MRKRISKAGPPATRGNTGRDGPVGPPDPKGEPSVWMTEAYDSLERLIVGLREDVDDLRTAVAALQEQLTLVRQAAPPTTTRVSLSPLPAALEP